MGLVMLRPPLLVTAIKDRVKAYQEAKEMKQPEPRVSATKPALQKVIEERIKAYHEAKKMKQPEPRVLATKPVLQQAIKERIKAYQEAKGMKQPEPRASVTTPHILGPRVQTSEHTETRVPTLEQAVPRKSLVKAFPHVKAALKCFQETLTTPTPPIDNYSDSNENTGGTNVGKTQGSCTTSGQTGTCSQYTFKI